MQAFHDFTAYNAATQTEGLDASIFYELDRAEVPPSGVLLPHAMR